MTPKETFRRYTAHTLVYGFARALFGSFGTFLIYEKTRSILWTLLFWTFAHAVGIVMRSVGMVALWPMLRRLGIPVFMGIGVVLVSIGTGGLYYLEPGTAGFVALLTACAFFFETGMSIYWVPSNAIYYSSIGKMRHAGHGISHLALVRGCSAILAAVIGMLLSRQGSFDLLLLLSAAIGVLSIIPLRGLRMKVDHDVNFLRSFRALSGKAVAANLYLEAQVKGRGLPFILLLIPLSLGTSIWISGATIIAATLAAHVAGHVEGKGNRIITAIALFIGMATWIGYGFASVPWAFILLGALYEICIVILDVDTDARLCREISNTGHAIEEMVAIETIRISGAFIGDLIVLGTFLLLGTIPQALLFANALLMLPEGLYALGGVAERVRARRAGRPLPVPAQACERHGHHAKGPAEHRVHA